jgi:hypothetical protein
MRLQAEVFFTNFDFCAELINSADYDVAMGASGFVKGYPCHLPTEKRI